MTSAPSRWALAFSLDLRSLAVFRVLLGFTLMAGLVSVLCHAGVFYSDAGLAPRSWWLQYDTGFHFSLHLLNGSMAFVVALTLVQLAAAAMLLIGYRTRLAVVVSWLLWASLLSRNTLVITPGDLLIASLLFWAMFLPLDARYSVRSALSSAPTDDNTHRSWAGAGLLLAATLPLSASLWGAWLHPEGSLSAWLPQLLQRESLTTNAGQWWLRAPAFLATISMAVGLWSLVLPLCVLSPWARELARRVAAIGLVIIALFAIVFMDVGTLPWALLAVAAALPGDAFWRTLLAWDARRAQGNVQIYVDGTHASSTAAARLLTTFLVLPRARIAPAQDHARAKALLLANRSWVVVDHAEQAHLKWAALCALLQASPIKAWVGALLRALPLQKLGDALYDAWTRQRSRLDARAAHALSAPPAARDVPRAAAWLAMLLVLVNTVAIVAGLFASTTPVARLFDPIRQALHQNVAPNLLSPARLQHDGWLMANAKMLDGSEVDLLRETLETPNFERPPHDVIVRDGLRWLSYREAVRQGDASSLRQRYAEHLCRSWNDRLPPTSDRRLQHISFIDMREMPLADNTAPTVEQRLLGTDACTR